MHLKSKIGQEFKKKCFPNKHDVRLVFQLFIVGSCPIYVICDCLHVVVSSP